MQVWAEHFEWQSEVVLPLTPTGRATVAALAMNPSQIVAIRQEELVRGRHPPHKSIGHWPATSLSERLSQTSRARESDSLTRTQEQFAAATDTSHTSRRPTQLAPHRIRHHKGRARNLGQVEPTQQFLDRNGATVRLPAT